jgi:hypothetical protein
VSSSRIAYAMRLDATSEGEVAALSNVYKFVLDCHAKKKAASESRPDDAEGSKNDRTATEIIPEPS